MALGMFAIVKGKTSKYREIEIVDVTQSYSNSGEATKHTYLRNNTISPDVSKV